MYDESGVQLDSTDAEPFNIRVHARWGYPLPVLAGGEGEGGEGGDSGASDAGEQGGEAEAEGQGNDLYDLSTAPEELRPFLEEQLKTVQKNVGTRFEEAAQSKKDWQPFEDMGIKDVPVEDLQELLSFRELLGDRDGFTEWLKSAGEQLGLTFADGEAQVADEAAVDPLEGQQDQEALTASIMEQVKQAMAPMQEFIDSQTQEKAVGTAEQALTESLTKLETEHGEFDRSAVVALAHAYVNEDDPIGAAFAEYQRITGGAQSDLLDTKSDAPGSALSGGQTDTTPPKFNGLNDPALKAAARERFAST